MEENKLIELKDLSEKYNVEEYMFTLCDEIAKMVDKTLDTFPCVNDNVVDRILDIYMDDIRQKVLCSISWVANGEED